MLILTRKIGQKLIIDEDIIITVVSIVDGKVSIGIEAPKVIKIWRSELKEKDNGQG